MKYTAFLSLLLITLARSDELNHSFNTTAYDAFCLPPNPPCSIFFNASLWIPIGIPGGSSTVIINSSVPITLTAPADKVIDVWKISLIGNVNFLIDAFVTFPIGALNSSLVVCDNSTVVVRGTGSLLGNCAFFDNSALTVLDGGYVKFAWLNVTNSKASLQITGGEVEIDQLFGVINTLNVSGNATLTTTCDIFVNSIFVSGTASFSQDTYGLYISSYGQFLGSLYTLQALYIDSSNVSISGCPLADSIYITDSSAIINTDFCNFSDIQLSSGASISSLTVRGNGVYNFSSITNDEGQGKVNFEQILDSSTQITLGYSDFSVLDFKGNYEVFLEYHDSIVAGTSIIPKISVDGNVSLTGSVLFLNYNPVPGLNIVCKSYGTMSFSNSSIDLNSGFQWLSGGIIVLEQDSGIRATNILLTEGQELELSNNDGYHAVTTNNFTIGKESTLYVTQNNTVDASILDLSGTIQIWGIPQLKNQDLSLTLNGDLWIHEGGSITLPQRIYAYVLDQYSHIHVNGEVHLGGNLNVILTGYFPSRQNSVVEVFIPILSATTIYGNFTKFNGTIPGIAYTAADLSFDYQIANNTVFLHYKLFPQIYPSPTPTPTPLPLGGGGIATKWLIIGGGGGGGFVLLVIIVVVVIVKRRRGHHYASIPSE